MSIELSVAPFSALVGEGIVELVMSRAPTKVRNRVAKALEHYTKVTRLIGSDEEMGAIRLIAAEEELVVAIFEWLKLNAEHMPEHKDFIGMYKNHFVKLAFYPVLSQLAWVLADMLERGITVDGLEDHLHWSVSAVRDGDRVVLRVTDTEGKTLLDVNPLDVAISLGDETGIVVIDSLYHRFSEEVDRQHQMSLKQFITARAEFRNKLLYAEDGGLFSMAETLQELKERTFSPTIRHLLWVLAILLTNKPTIKSWGLVNQFVTLYRKVLIATKILRVAPATE